MTCLLTDLSSLMSTKIFSPVVSFYDGGEARKEEGIFQNSTHKKELEKW